MRQRPLWVALILTATWLLTWWAWAGRYATDRAHYQQIETAVQEEIAWSEGLLHDLRQQLTEYADPYRKIKLPARYPVYVYNQGQLVYWSEHRLVPSTYELQQGDTLFLYQKDESQYLAITEQYMHQEQTLLTAVLIPLRTDFRVNNTYLQPEVNERIFASPALRIASPEADGMVITAPNQTPLFSVELGRDYTDEGLPGQWVLLYLGLLAFLAWAWWLGRTAWSWAQRGRTRQGAALLVLGGLLLRGLMVYLDLPNRLLPTPLFDLRNFYLAPWSPSLGDLLLHVALVVGWGGYLFSFYRKMPLFWRVLRAPRPYRAGLSALFQAGALGVLSLLLVLVQVLYQSSVRLSLDVSSATDFNTLRLAGMLLLVLAAVGYFLYSHVSLRLSFRLLQGRPGAFWAALAAVLLLWCLLPLDATTRAVLVGVHLVYVALLFRLQLAATLAQVRYRTFLYFFVNLIASAVVLGYGVFVFEKARMVNEKQRFSSSLTYENDFLGEYYLNEVGNQIGEDRFIITHLATPYLSKGSIVEKIRRVHLPDHFNRYDVDIYLFNSRGEPWYNAPPGLTYQTLLDNYAVEAYATDYPNLYFRQELDANLSERYLRMVEIRRNDFLVGHVVLDLRLKRLLPNSLYPQLFVNQTVEPPQLPEESSYAIYQQGRMVFHTGPFNYFQDLDLEAVQQQIEQPEGVVLKGFHHWGEIQPGGRLIVISTPLRPLSRVMGNFSLFYLIFVFATLLSISVYAVRYAVRGQGINYATKIQLYLNLSFFIPLFAVSVTTVSIISSAYQEEVTEDYFNRARSIATNLGEELTRYTKSPADKEAVEALLAQLAKHTESDIHLYNVNGELITSSQLRMLENGYLSEYINPYALAQVRELRNNQVILDESIGELEYKAVYWGVSSYQSGELIGILSIPFFDARQELDREVGLVLTSVMNIFTVLFLLFLVALYFLSETLTFPLRLITQKIRRTTLSERNEPLEWRTDDEIGMMVGEYNRMVSNLEASKEALARSEKESAWREMAKQVAHEIKNPLTPMKLTLQHLRRKLASADQAPGEEMQAPIDSLLKQVDTLSDIATSFSSFAKMPVPQHEAFDLEEVVRATVTLHAKEGSVSAEVAPGSYRVLGDEKLMGRIISNLIINGMQSVPAGREPKVVVRLRPENGKVMVAVEDNGGGIEEEIQNKVFVPNFSTKYTGSGIGLAIAKRGIEHAGGRIWFETELGQGTVFYIELPRLNP